jgi:SAM-dependent methyltransferase
MSITDDDLNAVDLTHISSETVGHYNRNADDFWAGTRDHDVSQNIDALLGHIEGEPPFRILDFGCGPGRDLADFRNRGHDAVGLDGSHRFCEMARTHSGCEVLCQDFLSLDLPTTHFDGVFANASLFHVPLQELPRVLRELGSALKSRGVLFASNPRGSNDEGWNGQRYGSYHDETTWRQLVATAGFDELGHYYRPAGRPRHEQPWLATIWRTR